MGFLLFQWIRVRCLQRFFRTEEPSAPSDFEEMHRSWEVWRSLDRGCQWTTTPLRPENQLIDTF